MTFLLSGLQSAVQSELDRFFANLENRADSKRKVTAQAFSKARYKIRQHVFVWVNQQLMALGRSICLPCDGKACVWWPATAVTFA